MPQEMTIWLCFGLGIKDAPDDSYLGAFESREQVEQSWRISYSRVGPVSFKEAKDLENWDSKRTYHGFVVFQGENIVGYAKQDVLHNHAEHL